MPDNRSAVFESLLWMAGLVLVILLATAVLGWFRRWLRASHQDQGGSFTLEDLWRIRDRGDVTVDEYNALRRSLIAGIPGERDSG